MIKSQNIFFDNSLNFNVMQGGIVENNTEILNLFFHDNCDSNSLALIGTRLEWKPAIWLEFEQENIKKVKEINIVCLLGDLTEFFYYCQKKFINIKINYYLYNLYLQVGFIKNSLINKKHIPAQYERKNNIYSSTGSIRLNRYILIKEGLDKGYDFYYPAISYDLSKDFEYQISQCLGTAMQHQVEMKQRRIFEKDILQSEFNARQAELLCESYINVVATFPNSDWLTDKDDEKYFDTILCKTVPFMLCEKDSNVSGVELLGFLPYKGFNFTSDSNDNPVLRWKSLLEDNEHIFKDKEQVKELYDKNQKIIEHNFNRLVNTDWGKERLDQYNRLPEFINEYLDTR